MEDIFVTKIIEAEAEADKLIQNSKNSANELIENYTSEYNLERKKIEKKYDDLTISSQEKMRDEFEKEFNLKLDDMKNQINELKTQYEQKYDSALKILLSGVSDNGNS